MSNLHLPWFAIQVKARCEKVVAHALHCKGYEEFLPLCHARRCWSDRVRDVELPLFPGYLFCRLDPSRRLPVLTTPGVGAIVSCGRAPAPVDPAEVEAIQNVVRSGAPAAPWPYLDIGERVRIEAGPLRGLEGILLRLKNSQRLVVGVRLLQRSIAVEIEEGWVVPVVAVRKPVTGNVSERAVENFCHGSL